MSSIDNDAYTLANEGSNVYYFKQIEEALFSMQQRVKKTIDQGLPPDEFKQVQLLEHVLNTAAEITAVLQK